MARLLSSSTWTTALCLFACVAVAAAAGTFEVLQDTSELPSPLSGASRGNVGVLQPLASCLPLLLMALAATFPAAC
jgi:TRAP-type C4-dicarboxylate transport system permease small subunit